MTVLRVEQMEPFGAVVHLAVDGLAIDNPKVSPKVILRVPHLPFAKAAVDRSVVQRIGQGPTPAHEEGYQAWRHAVDAGGGGVFTITIAEAVALLDPSDAT